MKASPLGTPLGTVKFATSEPAQPIGSKTQVIGRNEGSLNCKTAWHLAALGT